MKKRILVVDDSLFMRRMIKDLIESDPQFEVVAMASNGKEAVQFNQTFQPDGITLDVEMPVMNGLEALKQIMESRPVPVIMLSSLTKTGQQVTIEAMLQGAVDYVAKPSGSLSLDIETVKLQLLTKLRAATQARLSIHSGVHINEWPSRTSKPKKEPVRGVGGTGAETLVCIGSSTGGPRALEQVLTRLPGSLQAPVIVVQHMPAHFTKTLAQRLNNASQLVIKEAEHGDILKKGTVYLAPGGWQMKLKKVSGEFCIELDDSPPVKGLKPCFDLFLESLVPYSLSIVYVVLTGMGSDGTKGLKVLKEGHVVHAIAESEDTAVIYGMPKAAIQTGLVDEVAGITEISDAILNQLTLSNQN